MKFEQKSVPNRGSIFQQRAVSLRDTFIRSCQEGVKSLEKEFLVFPWGQVYSWDRDNCLTLSSGPWHWLGSKSTLIISLSLSLSLCLCHSWSHSLSISPSFTLPRIFLPQVYIRWSWMKYIHQYSSPNFTHFPSFLWSPIKYSSGGPDITVM